MHHMRAPYNRNPSSQRKLNQTGVNNRTKCTYMYISSVPIFRTESAIIDADETYNWSYIIAWL